MILQPVGDNIVLKIKEKAKEEVKESGFIMLNQGTEQSLRTDIGEVVAVGEGRYLNNGQLLPLIAKEGQEVLYNKFAGTQVVLGTEKFLIIKETDILAIVK